MAQPYYGPPAPQNTSVSIGDGFLFGCGFLLAGLVASIGMGLIFFVLTLILGAASSSLLR